MPRRHAVILCLYLAVVFACWIDITLRRTELISPVAEPLLTVMLCAGGLLGIVPAILLFIQARASQRAGLRSQRPLLSLVVALIALPLICAMVSGYTAERLTEMYAFWGSDAVVAPVLYPITAFRTGRHGPYASLDHGAFDLPISFADETLLKASPPSHQPWAHCLSVVRQQQGDAVRIVLPPRPHRNVQSILPCPRSVAWLP
ncbi:MAG: hypothetical protein WC729_00635 [Sphingomonas sp.]|jgi:hypothetical protein|uniref:hypothetical protein n=1 Tax=Sphingomonas sp. TaxID=28214 RepID=UPI00356AB6A8